MTKPANIVSGHRARDKWIIALCSAGSGMPPLDFRTAIGISTYFNCTTGQCNPGYTKLAKLVGATRNSVKRACRKLEAAGWIRRNSGAGGDHEDTVQFDLLMPVARGSALDPRQDQTRGSKTAATGVQNGGGRGSIADSLMNTENTENTERSAPTARAPVPVEIQSVITTRDNSAPDGADLRYLLHEAREAYALSQTQTEPLRTIISDALSIMPKSFVVSHITASPSCQDFLASIASAKMELTAYSS